MDWLYQAFAEQSIMSTAGRMLHVLAATSSSPAPLQAYNVDPTAVSVSGLSAGASFTMQLGIAYSDVFTTGFGVFAGQPYDCARNQPFKSNCSQNAIPNITIPLHNLASWDSNRTLIAPLKNLYTRRSFFWVGGIDHIVGPNVTWTAHDQLLKLGVPAAQVKNHTSPHAPHTFPTNFNYPNISQTCSSSEAPYVSNCGYDGAGEVLGWLYGNGSSRLPNPRNDGVLSGQIVPFVQNGSLAATDGMADTGYLYVPEACRKLERCKLHVAMHGCSQSATNVGLTFVNGTGYNQWADTNNIIMLYPQAKPVNKTYYPIFDNRTLSHNPACWDWLGIYGTDCDQRPGKQMSAVVAQVNRILGRS